MERVDEIDWAAEDHVEDIGPAGILSHTGTDGSSPSERISRYIEWGSSGENIAFGQRTGKDVVLDLIIDDGVPSRGHRDNIYNGGFE